MKVSRREINHGREWHFDYVSTGDVYGLAIAIPVLATIAVSLRFFVRNQRKVGIRIDDWLLVPALLSYIGVCITFIIGAAKGVMGVGVQTDAALEIPDPLHGYVLPSNPLFAKLQFSYQILSILTTCFMKLSIVALYQRIFALRKTSKFAYIAKATHVVIVVWSLTFLLMAVLACPSAPAAQWSGDLNYQSSTCTTAFGAGEALVITDFILDLWLIVLPQPLVWRLQMSAMRKVMISGIFLLGMSCVGFTAARIAIYSELQGASDSRQPLDRDQVITVNIWFGALDIGVGLIACCLPTLRPLLKDLSVKKLISSFTGSSLSGNRQSKSMSTADKATADEPDSRWRRLSRGMWNRDTERGALSGGDSKIRTSATGTSDEEFTLQKYPQR